MPAALRPEPPRWLPWAALALALAGLAISSYLTLVHYTSQVRLACSATGVIDCERVTTSPQSMVAGVPVALLGVAFFAVAALLVAPPAWRSPALGWVRIAWLTAGVCMVVRLLYAELFEIDAICLWCTAVHAITVGLFATVLVGQALAAGETRAAAPVRAGR
jgi:uncharacterized membrane protein